MFGLKIYHLATLVLDPSLVNLRSNCFSKNWDQFNEMVEKIRRKKSVKKLGPNYVQTVEFFKIELLLFQT
jgi:hypothetical protein